MKATQSDLSTSIGLLVLRVVSGGYMATHGWGKVQMVLAGDFAKFGDPIGLGNTLSLILAAGAEFGCALLVVVGLGTRLAAIPVAFTMAVAGLLVHAQHPWTSGAAADAFFAGTSKDWFSKEPALVFCAVFSALFFTGPGKFSLDATLARRSAEAKLKGK